MSDEIGERLHRQVGAHDEEECGFRRRRHRHEVFRDVDAHLVEVRAHQDPGVRCVQQRVAVGRRPAGDLDPDQAPGADAVIDDDLLPEYLG
jgi:hypothetical protein